MTRLLDLHTHIFNVGFLPVHGILLSRNVDPAAAESFRRFLERNLERDLPQATALARSGFEAQRAAFLEGLGREMTTTAEDEPGAPDFIAWFAMSVPAEIVREFQADFSESRDQQFVSESTRVISDMRLRSFEARDDISALRARLDRLLREIDTQAGPVETGEEDHGEFASSGKSGLVQWMLMLVQHEARLAARYEEAWSGSPQCLCRTHYLMDMCNHYQGKPPVYDMDEQHRRVREVARNSPHLWIGFTAFDPFREHGLAIVKQAIAAGFCGVKFYPPNGYKPIDNDPRDIVRGPSPDEVNRRNLELFTWCADEGVPVFTHCTPSGFESRPKVGRFSNPRYWRRVLDTPGLKHLRLCFGHGGGAKGWFARTNAPGDRRWRKSYACEVVAICHKFPNVYCDFGFLDDILSGKDYETFAARLELVARQYPDTLPRKICYGTDWHLISRLRHAERYPDRFRAVILASPSLHARVDDVMVRNARNFLDPDGFLRRSGAQLTQRERDQVTALREL